MSAARPPEGAGTAGEAEGRPVSAAAVLQGLRAGFHDQALGSQAVFRTALEAMAHPGRPLPLPPVAELPRSGQAAAAMLLLALLDADCSAWLSPGLARGDAGAWLRFHTGCRLAATPEQADFLWIGLGDALPALDGLRLGTDLYPDESATAVVEVAALQPDAAQPRWWLAGPGIAGRRGLTAQGAPAALAAQHAQGHALFPRGLDMFLASATLLAGLPRSTRITVHRED